MTDTSDLLWNVDMEVNLFHAMRGHKPAGINRHFQMVSIHDRLSSAVKKITSQDVWDHLSTLYDLRALNESEVVPFPNTEMTEFELLDSDMLDLCLKSFPRTNYFSNTSEMSKAPADKVSTPKTIKTEVKQEVRCAPASTKCSTPTQPAKQPKPVAGSAPSSTPSSTPRTGSTPSSTPSPAPSIPLSLSNSLVDPSPVKRTKRTRVSATNSPATPTEPPQKRRR